MVLWYIKKAIWIIRCEDFTLDEYVLSNKWVWVFWKCPQLGRKNTNKNDCYSFLFQDMYKSENVIHNTVDILHINTVELASTLKQKCKQIKLVSTTKMYMNVGPWARMMIIMMWTLQGEKFLTSSYTVLIRILTSTHHCNVLFRHAYPSTANNTGIKYLHKFLSCHS